jgi:cardiolipin synthase A/B
MEGGIGALLVVGQFALQVVLAVIVLSRRRGRNETTLSWVFVILILPVVGALVYLMVGEVRIGSRRTRRHGEIVEHLRKDRSDAVETHAYAELSDEHQPIATLAEVAGGMIPRGGNVVELCGDTEGYIERLVADIAAAKEHCHLLYYIMLADESGERVARALAEAAARGVACRLLVDAVGSGAFLESPLRRGLAARGVQVVGALPASFMRAAFARIDLRNHRKIAVIDGRIGYTGSHNVANASFAPKPAFAPWVDCSIRVEGPAVRDLQQLFIEDWYLDTGEYLKGVMTVEAPAHDGGIPIQVMSTGPGARYEALVQLVQAAIHVAREELLLTTPYFVPDEGTADALATAARRGVATTLVLPHRNDSFLVGHASRSYYQHLLDSGVEIREYPHGLLHSKTLTVDRDLALITSANLDRRSFDLNFEVSVLAYDSDFASQLRFLQRSYVERSLRIDPGEWRARPWHARAVQNAAGAFSPLL